MAIGVHNNKFYNQDVFQAEDNGKFTALIEGNGFAIFLFLYANLFFMEHITSLDFLLLFLMRFNSLDLRSRVL